MKLLRVDMSNLTVHFEEEPAAYGPWWGRGLSAKVLLEEMDAQSDPLGPNNIFIITRGPMAGTGFSSSGRVSVGGRSPLTGGIKESNAGGNVAQLLAGHALKAIIVKGQAPKGSAYLLEIGDDKAQLKPVPELKGLGVYAQAELLQQRYFKKAGLALTGPAADLRMNIAGVVCTDRDGVPTRIAARGGLGTVMASKGLKALVVTPPSTRAAIVDLAAVQKSKSELNEFIMTTHMTSKVLPMEGTASMVATMFDLGGLPTHNFSHGQFELANNIQGTTLHKVIMERGGDGKTGHGCMTGCMVRCSNIFADSQGKEVVRSLEYETLVLMGANLGIGDLDTISRFNLTCNDLGIDTIETGAAIGVAMDAGVWHFGDVTAVEEALSDIRQGTIRGRMLGAGATTTGRVLGWNRVPATKGQAMAAYDPRAIKGIGTTYATTPMGADHTAGHTAAFRVDHHSPEGQVDVSRESQIIRAAYDTLGLCMFLLSATMAHPDKIIELLNGTLGTNYPPEELTRIGKDCLRMEREFNRRVGFTAALDRLPEFMCKEKLPPFDLVYDVAAEELDQLFNF